ncbi:MAG: ABC transporter substrate-binding protein [Acetobacteraceae bacterium]|nr:ABC transporter substrate-binding protein [Acetobacteraceae bacterium]
MGMARLAWLLLFAVLAVALPARAEDKIRFGIDWTAEAEYGGYYQAVAAGIYKKHGLDVTIAQGGPQVNHLQLLIAGRLDFAIISNSLLALNLVQQAVPYRAVAAIFQKDPSVLIAHPGADNDSFEALRGKPIMISSDTRAGWWNFLKAKFGYTDAQVRPYTFNLQPFLTDSRAIQQGFLGSEPFSIQQASGQYPVVMLIADAGYAGYAGLIGTSDKNIAERTDLVQRFVDASIEGWHSYLEGDPAPGNALIKQANPEMTDALLAYGRDSMKKHGIVQSGDAATHGIGAMSSARWQDFYRAMSQAGLYPPGLDVTKAYTLQFVNRGLGLSAKP